MTANRTSSPDATGEDTRQVSVALLTYQRTDELVRAVHSVIEQCRQPDVGTDAAGRDWALHQVLIVDNNPDGSAEPAVTGLQDELGEGRIVWNHSASSPQPTIRYVHEPRPGIVAGRNRALDEAEGDVLIFLDDDEIALPGWPHGLLATMSRTGASMVGGPVVNEFVEPPPDWVVDGRFFEIDPAPDDAPRTWLSTCNLAMDLGAVRAAGLRFDPRYPHGEDGMFTRLAATRGLTLAWSSSAAVKEFIPPERTTLSWRLHRQRISTDAWVRTELDLDRSFRSKAVIVARTAVRLVQGLAATAVGAATSKPVTRNRGLSRLAQARGAFEGLVGHGRHRRRGM
jgi:hypothetical protein